MSFVPAPVEDRPGRFSAEAPPGAADTRIREVQRLADVSLTGPRNGWVREHARIVQVTAFALAIAAFVGDWFTGSEVASSLLYVIAIMFGSWFAGRTTGFLLAGLSVLGWLAAGRLTGVHFSKPSVLYWNLFAESGIYGITALAVAEAKLGLDRVHMLAARLEESHHALDRETRAVGELQRGMLPGAPPEIPGYEWETIYETSTRAGGDYYDFLHMPGGRIGILVADASGHGAPAAVLMAMTRVLLLTASDLPDPPDRVLARLNDQLAGTLPRAWFVTACYAVLEPGSGRLEYSLAGHHAPVVVRCGEERPLRLPDSGGLPLGLYPSAAYESGSTILGPGDTLVLYTDGLTESMSPTRELWGDERLHEALRASRAATLREMRGRLLASVEAHRSGTPPSDDMTLLLLRRSGVGSAEPGRARA